MKFSPKCVPVSLNDLQKGVKVRIVRGSDERGLVVSDFGVEGDEHTMLVENIIFIRCHRNKKRNMIIKSKFNQSDFER